MRMTLAVLLSLALSGAMALAQDAPAAKGVENIDPKALPRGNERFAVDMYRELLAQKGNLFLSPYSVSEALAMTYLGAGGQTKEEMRGVLCIPSGHLVQNEKAPWADAEVAAAYKDLHGKLAAQKDKFELQIANALWGQTGKAFREPYVKLVADEFGGKLDSVDFSKTAAACRTINDWVAKQTKGKISDLLSPQTVPANTQLVLTNAVYFKAAWREQFKAGNTRKGAFLENGATKVNTPMMDQTENFLYGEVAGAKVLEMPYAGDALAMTILLPNRPDGLGQLEKDLAGPRKAPMDKFGFTPYFDSLKRQGVHVVMPKFRFMRQFLLADTLSAMGMKLAFDPDKADFTGMCEDKGLYIKVVIHKAFIDVNEDGTEAAAATAVVSPAEDGGAIAPENPKQFVANHPFLFVIRHKATGSVLFMGRFCSPTYHYAK